MSEVNKLIAPSSESGRVSKSPSSGTSEEGGGEPTRKNDSDSDDEIDFVSYRNKNKTCCGQQVSLAQRMHDEFLVCKICLEDYKTPKCLDCMHTFCEECIENHVFSESSYKKYSDYR